jgi:hypothetical protein
MAQRSWFRGTYINVLYPMFEREWIRRIWQHTRSTCFIAIKDKSTIFRDMQVEMCR